MGLAIAEFQADRHDGAAQGAADALRAHAGAEAGGSPEILFVHAEAVGLIGGDQNGLAAVIVVMQIDIIDKFFQHCSFLLIFSKTRTRVLKCSQDQI